VGVLVICVLVCTVFCIVSFMYIYCYLFCLYYEVISTIYSVVRIKLYLKSGTWSILYYQLHVSAFTLVIIRLA